MNKLKYYIAGLLCLANVSMAIAQTPQEVVQTFGDMMTIWCETGEHTYRQKIESLCDGIKKCRVEDKIHSEYQLKKGLRDYETFVLHSYLNMFENEMTDGLRYKLSDIEVCVQDEMSEGQKLTFLTATIDISGPVNKQVKDLFLVRDDKISGIYSYDSQLGFSHLNGSLIKELEFGRYRWTSGFSNGLAIVSNENGAQGLIDIKGNIIIPCIWDVIYYVGGDFAKGGIYKGDNKEEMVYDLRYNGKEVPFYWVEDWVIGRKKTVTTFCNGFAVTQNSNGKYGYLKEDDANYCISYIYDSASNFNDGYASVSINGHSYIIDSNLQVVKTVDPDLYEFNDHFYEGLAKIKDKRTGKWGFMNTKGEIVIPCQFDQTGYFSEGICFVRKYDNPSRSNYYKSYHTALIDKKGYLITPYEFEESQGIFEDGYIEMIKEINGKLKATLIGPNGLPLPGFNWEDNLRYISAIVR